VSLDSSNALHVYAGTSSRTSCITMVKHARCQHTGSSCRQLCTAAWMKRLQASVCVMQAQYHSQGLILILCTAPVCPCRVLFSVPKYIWEAVSHELGHALGLSHDNFRDASGTVQYYHSAVLPQCSTTTVQYYHSAVLPGPG
jgi:hypothetical protein